MICRLQGLHMLDGVMTQKLWTIIALNLLNKVLQWTLLENIS